MFKKGKFYTGAMDKFVDQTLSHALKLTIFIHDYMQDITKELLFY